MTCFCHPRRERRNVQVYIPGRRDPAPKIRLSDAALHQWFGHLGDYRRFNPTVTQDADQWHRKVRGS